MEILQYWKNFVLLSKFDSIELWILLQVIFKKLWLDYSLSAAIEDARPYHTLFPEYIRNEKENPLADDIVQGLKAKNHKILIKDLNAIIQGVFVDGDKIYAKSDPRKEGKAAGY